MFFPFVALFGSRPAFPVLRVLVSRHHIHIIATTLQCRTSCEIKKKVNIVEAYWAGKMTSEMLSESQLRSGGVIGLTLGSVGLLIYLGAIPCKDPLRLIVNSPTSGDFSFYDHVQAVEQASVCARFTLC